MFESEINCLDYAYEIVDKEDVYTYIIKQKNNELYRICCGHYYFSILGIKTIDKLRGRGYLSIQEIYQKYGVSQIPIIEQPKKNFVKTLFKMKY